MKAQEKHNLCQNSLVSRGRERTGTDLASGAVAVVAPGTVLRQRGALARGVLLETGSALLKNAGNS